MTNVLPAGSNASALARALDGFRVAVGDDAVLTSEESISEFRDPYWFSGWDDFEASAAVQPQSVEEIQAVLKVANEQRIPLWVSSQGRNNGYGGSSPRVRGAVVVNLRRMDQVLEINADSAYAVVEPGVSFTALYDAVRARASGPEACVRTRERTTKRPARNQGMVVVSSNR
jgi:4-cresol dehydrogenase (hydroxylating)